MDWIRAFQLGFVAVVGLGTAISHEGSRQRELLDERLAAVLERADTSGARALLERGARIETRDGEGNTVLMLATWSGDATFVRQALDRGADINARNASGSTALMLAAEYGRSDIVELLLARGADRTVRGKYGLDALGAARLLGRESVVRVLTASRPKKMAAPVRSDSPAPSKRHVSVCDSLSALWQRPPIARQPGPGRGDPKASGPRR